MTISIERLGRAGCVAFAALAMFALGCSDMASDNPPGGDAGSGGSTRNMGGSAHGGQGAGGYAHGGSSAGGISYGGEGGISYGGAGGAGMGGANGGAANGGGGAANGGGGTGGASAGGGGGGGVAGAGEAGAGEAGAGPGVLSVSTDALLLVGTCSATPQALTISNTGESALTWDATVSSPLIAVNPASSRLLPGAQVTVSATSTEVMQQTVAGNFQITINSDVAGQTAAVIAVLYDVQGGQLIPPRRDVDVGNVSVGENKTVPVPTPQLGIELALSSSNPDFVVASSLAHGADHWDLVFTPRLVDPGAESTTLTITAPFATICPASVVFTAHGVGVP